MHTLTNARGLVLKAIDRGAIITQLHTPDREGNLADVVLGYDHAADYAHDPFYLGAVVGRCANRIARGSFSLDGSDHTLAVNNPPNHLHGGVQGFDKHTWDAERIDDPRGPALRFSRTSPDGEEGYPGNLKASVTYILTDTNELICEMRATSDAPTLCNLAQHTYWNLTGVHSGENAGDGSERFASTIENHDVTLFADHMTPTDADAIPTGEFASVAGTPFDFRTPKPIGRDMHRVGDDPTGYDHNYVVNGEPGTLRPVARVVEPTSGRVMTLSATRPGVQLYTGNFLDGKTPGKGGVRYPRHSGLCLETQHHPDAINKPDWPSPVLRPGETDRHTMVFAFSTDRDAQ